MKGKVLLLFTMTIFAVLLISCGTKEIIVTFETNGGTNIEEIIIVTDETFELPAAPTREGYEFEGWYTDSDLTTKFMEDSIIPAENFILYAKWEIKEYSIEFETNGGTLLEKIWLNYGETIELPADPTKEGYEFEGWYTDSDLTIKFTEDSVMLTENFTLYAKWTEFLSSIDEDFVNIGGDEAVASIEGNEVTISGTIDWYPADEETNLEAGNRVGLVITAPTGFDASGATIEIDGNVYTNIFTSENNEYTWIVPVTEGGEEFEATVTWKAGHKQTFRVIIDENITLKEEKVYNFYATLGTLPTLYAGLAMYENEVESYAWYLRSGTFNNEYLPEYVTLMSNQATNGSNSPIDFRIMLDKMIELKEEEPNAMFNLYIDDLRTQLILDLLVAAGIDESRYTVTLLSDGTGTYNIIKSITETEWNNRESTWNSYLGEYLEGTTFKWGYNTSTQTLQKWAGYVSTFDNVSYWLQFPEYMINSNSSEETHTIESMNLIKKDPGEMYAALSAEKKALFESAVLSSASSTIDYYNGQFLNRDKEILIITGTNKAGLETNVSYIDQVVEDYGDTHYMYFKPHPAYPPNAELLEYFETYNIIVLPHRTPMEAIMWMFPEVEVGGYNSSLYMSAAYGQTLFFFGSIGSPLTDLRDYGHFDNVTYYQYEAMLSGTIDEDLLNVGGDEAVASIEGNEVTISGTIDWYPADEETNLEAGNRVGLVITAPTGFDASGATIEIDGNVYTNIFTSENNEYTWIVPVTEGGEEFEATVTWKAGHKQTFRVIIDENITLD